ncbi:MAG: hypothetical protein FWC53_01455 [Firmicutes bacterium]|nr:hypothetical protein [Bacillota bacterium]
MENLSKVQRIVIIGIAAVMLLVIGYYIMHKTNQYTAFDAGAALQVNNAAEGGVEQVRNSADAGSGIKDYNCTYNRLC